MAPLSVQQRFALLGLSHLAPSEGDKAIDEFNGLVEPEASRFGYDLPDHEVDSLYHYDQPNNTPRMDLDAYFEPANYGALASPDNDVSQWLWRMNRSVERLRDKLGPGADWVGIYKVVSTSHHEQALVKLAYLGSTSRGLFPLTESFAKGSNNSTCAMTRRATVVADTTAIASDQPYYV